MLAWLFIVSAVCNNANNYNAGYEQKATYILHIILFNLCFVFVVYFNTLWLMPILLFRKKYIGYLIALSSSVFLVAVVMSHYQEWLQLRFPGSSSSNYSAISFGNRGSASLIGFYFSSASTIFLLVFIFSIGYLAQKYFEVSRQKEAIQQQQTITELHLLKSQINPHFLFNVLNSIYSLSLKRSDETPGVVLKLSDIMRYMLYETKHNYVPLQKEIDILRDYLDIEMMRIAGENSITFTVSGETKLYKIAPALLIPFIENAIKHGTDSILSQSYIHIQIVIENNILLFTCKNNFKLPLRTKDSGGIGLANVQKRLQLLYPDAHSLEISKEQNIFEVQLQLNLLKNEMPYSR